MWTGPTYQSYYQQIGRVVAANLEKEDQDYLLSVDPEKYLEFLVDHAKWEPLLWDESGKTVERFSFKRQRQDRIQGRYEIEVDGFRIRIPIAPHPQLEDYFKFGPSTTRGSEPPWKFDGDTLIFEVDATERSVEQGIEDVRFWLGNRNQEIKEGNAQLRDKIKPVWASKRKRLEERREATTSVLAKLGIPLYQDPHARVRPVEIKPRLLKTVLEKPKAGPLPVPTLNRPDVTGLVDFIEQYTRQFEVAPKTYRKMEEEELRDLLVGMMNANYPGSATGETFNKLGKTDISLRVDSGNVLVCECKFWDGPKAYEQAIDQLFRYLTWHQNYGVLIHFCRLKDMSHAVAEAQRITAGGKPATGAGLVGVSSSRFVTRHAHPQDAEKSVEVFHLFVDLSL